MKFLYIYILTYLKALKNHIKQVSITSKLSNKIELDSEGNLYIFLLYRKENREIK